MDLIISIHLFGMSSSTLDVILLGHPLWDEFVHFRLNNDYVEV